MKKTSSVWLPFFAILLLYLFGGQLGADQPNLAWPGWRGANRDGIGDALPLKLPPKVNIVWTHECEAEGLGGIAATTSHVLFAGRDALDTKDIITCLDLSDGSVAWQYDYAAMPPVNAETRDGKLDYGNTPRATPLIVKDRVVTFGAMGDLYCLELKSGELEWSLNCVLDFDAPIPTWGWSGSPVHHDGLIILQPGGTDSSVVAVKLANGEVAWETGGGRTAYTSPIVVEFAGVPQVITCDASFWLGFHAKTGKFLWRMKPERSGEFHVPTACKIDNRLLIVGEVNGARLYEFDKGGRVIPKAASTQANFSPDTHTPVRIGKSIIGAHNGLWVMSVNDLADHQEIDQSDFSGHCSIISDGQRFFVLADSGLLYLFEHLDGQVKQLGKISLVDAGSKIYAHPAWVNGHLIIREGTRIHCIKLK